MKAFASSSFRHYGQARQPAPIAEDAVSEEAVTVLTHKIMDISSKLVAKDELASQQARIAKEAVEDLIKKDEELKKQVLALKEEKSAREKAEADYLSLEQELDKVCQQKGLVETRMMQLNGVLKDCMDELQQVKDQLEHKTQEATSRKREWDKLKTELESENTQLKRQLMEATAENIALSKSLQERGRSLNEINGARAKVESDSKILQVQIESLHKDIDAYKYEIHVLKKELQLRNDEREQNRKLADATHKQHLESVKKIAKLDSECNRLRALVRKKLPGPAAIAQMRVEGDHVGKRRMPNPKPFPLDQRDMEALNHKLAAMEHETKLLKESLAKKTAELQVARQLCARTASKLSSAEGVIDAMARGQALPASGTSEENHTSLRSSKCDSSQQKSFALPPAPLSGGGESMEVMDWALSSEDGNYINDDALSSTESWASALIAELSHLKKDDGSPSIKPEESGKPGIRIVSPLVQDFDLQTALQELNIKLSSVGESILALPFNMRCVGDQGYSNEIKPLNFGMLGQIMEEFTFVKQLLVEVQKAIMLDKTNQSHVVQLDRSLQESKTKKTDGSVVIDECNDITKTPKEIDSEKETHKELLRKVMDALLVSAESKQENVESKAEANFVSLPMAVDGLDNGRDLHNLSEEAASELLCRIGHMVKEHCIASWAPADIGSGQNFIEETGWGEIGMSIDGEFASGDRESTVVSDEHELMSGIDNNGGAVEIGVNRDASCSELDVNHSFVANSVNEVKLDVGGMRVPINEQDMGRNGAADSVPDKELTESKLKCELTVQTIEPLQHEAERLRAERDELAAKLVASQAQIEQQLVRIATLEAESLLLASEKASLAEQMREAADRNKALQEELAEADASLDDLREQVSSLTSELADQASRCQELQGQVMAVSDVGAPPKARTQNDTDADVKHRKEHEIASAKAQLAECQRTILVLGSQISALSSAEHHVAVEPSFDSSLESPTSTDQINLPPTALADADGSPHVAERKGRSRRPQPGYVRTRGGRLVSAEQYWGSGREMMRTARGENQGTVCPGPSHVNRHLTAVRLSHGTACAQSPLHEYVSDHSAYVYSPPETALSSPATSPARVNLQPEGAMKGSPITSPAAAASLLKPTSNAAAPANETAGPSPARRSSRIARFFTRAKNQHKI